MFTRFDRIHEHDGQTDAIDGVGHTQINVLVVHSLLCLCRCSKSESLSKDKFALETAKIDLETKLRTIQYVSLSLRPTLLKEVV